MTMKTCKPLKQIFVVILCVALLLFIFNLYGMKQILRKTHDCQCMQPPCICGGSDNIIVRVLQNTLGGQLNKSTSNITFSIIHSKASAQSRTSPEAKTHVKHNETTISKTNRKRLKNGTKEKNRSKNYQLETAVKTNVSKGDHDIKNYVIESEEEESSEYEDSSNSIFDVETNASELDLDDYKESPCQIPVLEPFHTSIVHLMENKEPINCEKKNGHPDLSYVDETGRKLFLNLSSLPTPRPSFCSYSYILRESDEVCSFTESEVIALDEKVDHKKDVLLTDNIESDFLYVSCDNDEEYDDSWLFDMHAHISPIPGVTDKTLPKSALGLDVIVLGFDSTSHMNFIRQMPKSYKYLTETMQSVVLNGYNIVGDATAAALIPMLTGHLAENLPEARRNVDDAGFVDSYPFIWKQFKEQGYVTMFAEDSPFLGAFNRQYVGFDKQPTDHYMRPYWLTSVRSTPDYNSISRPKLCDGAKLQHKVMFDYLKEFQVKYKNIRKFGFMFLTELTHGNMNMIHLADNDLYNYLTEMYSTHHFDNTLFVMFGDHGARYTTIRATLQGRLEERLTFMSVFVPKAIRQSHPELYINLKDNSNRLTTPFDWHAMLKDVLNYSVNNTDTKAISLFKEISADRSCHDAGVDTHWCACLDWTSVDTTTSKVQHAAAEFLKAINNLTESVRKQCARLKIQQITHAERNAPNEK
uniref:Uncharacterized protein LOC100375624 n=1 Tax=Saccoglossus kowalevskii TaxID=10224 RepID=A0ABM0MAZ9_SACKO